MLRKLHVVTINLLTSQTPKTVLYRIERMLTTDIKVTIVLVYQNYFLTLGFISKCFEMEILDLLTVCLLQKTQI